MIEIGQRTFRVDYRAPAWHIEQLDLVVHLDLPVTRIVAQLHVRCVRGGGAGPLILNGERLALRSVALEGQPLSADRYALDEHMLSIPELPVACSLTIETEVRPADNPGLEGLNHADGIFYTHCEPEGFRRITYFVDRPDILTRYRCTLIADAERYPTLLSNGLLRVAGPLKGGRHFAAWNDPFPKASYLFALVAGRFDRLTDEFVTRSGRRVAIAVHAQTDPGACAHGLAALKRAMAWDERVYGREYDLDVFNIVVMRSYPGGAMECKGLNLYSTEFILASAQTSTDEELQRTAVIVGHEYFHNWTGNRVGCRDWFELSLKEGFTVLRQQQFMAALYDATGARIDDVLRLMEQQFPEDDAGMAHPVRPESYVAISNSYTRTVYEKGAELIRMAQLLIGEAAFHRAVDAFFARYDGSAATIDALLDALQAHTDIDLSQFRRWYAAVGRWTLEIAGTYVAETRRYTLTVRQRAPHRAAAAEPLHIPLRVGLLGRGGEALPLRLTGEASPLGTERLLQLRREQESFTFEDVADRPVPSIGRGFSAPVDYASNLDDEELAILALRDSDGFSRWNAGRQLVSRLLLRRLGASSETRAAADVWFAVVAELLARGEADAIVASRLLHLPSVRQLSQSLIELDPDRLHGLRRELGRETTGRFRDEMRRTYVQTLHTAESESGWETRRLRNELLWYLMRDPELEDLAACREQFRSSSRMANIAPALQLLVDHDAATRAQALAESYDRWRSVPAMLDRWFSVQAASTAQDCAQRVAALRQHADYSLANATRVKAIFDTFTANEPAFHDASGIGYATVITLVRGLEQANPRLAARFLRRFDGWQRLDAARRQLVTRSLRELAADRHLARDLREILTQVLNTVPAPVSAHVPIGPTASRR